MYESNFKGVRFIEGRPDRCRIISPVRIQIGGIITSSQLKTLDDVKEMMLKQVGEKGGNAVVDFKYGQKSVGFWKSLFDRDDVQWYGEGNIAVV